MVKTDNDDETAKRERSPSFPFIPLSKAVVRAQEVAAAHKRSPARVSMVAPTWGYAPKSSGLLQSVAALKAYGLLDDTGSGDDRRVTLTDLAWRIIQDTRPGAAEAAVKEAAIKPPLFSEYARNWLGETPNDDHRVSELTIDRGFTKEAARLFLKVFDNTVKFANLEKSDIMSLGDYMPDLPENPPVPVGGRTANPMRPMPSTLNPMPRATLPLPEGTIALELPHQLSKQSIEAVKAWLKVMVDLAERTAAPGPDSK